MKGNNRKLFENVLKQNIIKMSGNDCKVKIRFTDGRYFIECREDKEKSAFIENILSRLSGISGWAKTTVCQKTEDAVIAAAAEEAKKIYSEGSKTYKIDAKRTDKSFPLSSYDLCCKCAAAIQNEVSGLKVEIHNPDNVIKIEIREKAYIYSGAKKGLGGLPSGSAGRGLLLLSGGIDSPVAGFLMATRGMSIDAIHFHSYPYTSLEAKQKAINLAEVAGSYSPGLRLYILNFKQIQQVIKERSPSEWNVVLLRMAMMEAAEKAAKILNCKCLITGESLSQVASQTIENITCTQSRIKIPVLRPLIGMNKENIIIEAKRIGTFEISIQPHTDCCTLFTPKHPIIHGNPEKANEIYSSMEIDNLIDESLENCEQFDSF